MKTIKCSTCHKDKEEDEFYWHNRESKTLKSDECKTCISEKNKKKREEKKSELIFAF